MAVAVKGGDHRQWKSTAQSLCCHQLLTLSSSTGCVEGGCGVVWGVFVVYARSASITATEHVTDRVCGRFVVHPGPSRIFAQRSACPRTPHPGVLTVARVVGVLLAGVSALVSLRSLRSESSFGREIPLPLGSPLAPPWLLLSVEVDKESVFMLIGGRERGGGGGGLSALPSKAVDFGATGTAVGCWIRHPLEVRDRMVTPRIPPTSPKKRTSDGLGFHGFRQSHWQSSNAQVHVDCDRRTALVMNGATATASAASTSIVRATGFGSGIGRLVFCCARRFVQGAPSRLLYAGTSRMCV